MSPQAFDVAVARNDGRRELWTMSDQQWRKQGALSARGLGPMPTGPARLGKRVYVPVIDATTQPWRLSIYGVKRGRWSLIEVLNRTKGNAQGGVQTDGKTVWASWQEHAERVDGAFDTHIYTQRLAPVRGQAIELWSGVSLGPGRVDVVEGLGSHWALYMPSKDDGLTARIKAITEPSEK